VVYANALHCELRAGPGVELVRRAVERALDPVDSARAGGRGRGDVLSAGGNRCVGRAAEADADGLVVDVDGRSGAGVEAGGIAGAEFERQRAVAVLGGVDRLLHGWRSAL